MTSPKFRIRDFSSCLVCDLAARGKPHSRWASLRRAIEVPGHRVVVYYRIVAWLRRPGAGRGVRRILARLLQNRLTRCPGVEINTEIEIGPGLLIPHPHDIVIGVGARIGERVVIYNGVTLGGRQIEEGAASDDVTSRYPSIGDGCVLFAGAKILGPIELGDRCTVGANAVVLKSCGADATLVGIPARNIGG